MSEAARTAVIQEHCKELKLAAVVCDYPALCRQARDGAWAYEDLLRELLEAEVTSTRALRLASTTAATRKSGGRGLADSRV